MNLIINGFHHKTFFPSLLKILKHFNVSYAHFTYTETKLSVPSKINASFHQVHDLATGNYKIDWKEITPLDEKLIRSMNGCEVDVLKMMDRHSLSIELPLTYDERKNIYLKHLRYWNYIIEKNKIDLFISSSIPHETYDFIIYSLCKLKKIPTIFLHQTNILDTIFMMDDLNFNSSRIKNKYQELLKKYKFSTKKKIILAERFQKDFDLNTTKNKSMRTEMLRKKPSLSIGNNLISLLANVQASRFLTVIKTPDFLIQGIANHFNYITRLRTGKKIAKFYSRNTIKTNLTNKYIYFPLHLQPEASTSPMAGAFVNQILIAQMIAYYLPKDIYIYIKENPHQNMMRRSMQFYKELLQIPQVRFVPTSFNTYDLIDHSLAVATATGTAGLEALYRCKSVLMFGHNYYQYAKGIFLIKNNLDCQRALNKIIFKNVRPKTEDIKLFLKSLESNTTEGYIDVNYKKYTHISEKINNENIFKDLSKKIDFYFNS